jgi:glycine oxidase
MTDFLIVGRGLAATVLMHELHERGSSFSVIGDESLSTCSRVAAGIWHPVVFKRLTKSWNAELFIPKLLEFYSGCEKRLATSLITNRRLIRPFNEEQEIVLWKRKATEELKGFLDAEIRDDVLNYPELKMGDYYGYVQHCGNLDVNKFLGYSSDFFSDRISNGIFHHPELVIEGGSFHYKGLSAKQIVFCEGPLVEKNPFFSWVPMRLAKGELITVEFQSELMSNEIFNKNGFLMDIGNNRYRCGATYEWDELTPAVTPEGLAELKTRLKGMTDQEYTIIAHEAGVRPSSFDRRPVLGEHPAIKGMFILNGLGTKGVMLAPWFAAKFVNFCRQEAPLDPEVNVSRFYRLYDAAGKA